MKKLIDGIIEFRQNSLADYRAKFANLALGQSPDTLFIACCDSRVVPNVFASSNPGDLFVVRNIGNMIPPYDLQNMSDASTVAAIEFSVQILNVCDIVICGHSDCGAMRSFFNPVAKDEMPSFQDWLKFAIPSYQKFLTCPEAAHGGSQTNRLSKINVLQQVEHLKTYPYVLERLKKGQLRIHGWWFDLATADVYHYDSLQQQFVLVEGNDALTETL